MVGAAQRGERERRLRERGRGVSSNCVAPTLAGSAGLRKAPHWGRRDVRLRLPSVIVREDEERVSRNVEGTRDLDHRARTVIGTVQRCMGHCTLYSMHRSEWSARRELGPQGERRILAVLDAARLLC